MPTTLARTNYETLLEQVQNVLAGGRARAKAALEQEEVRTWWEAARIVNQHLRVHDGRAGYGEKVVPKLAGDLGITEAYLYDILRFQKAFPILNSSLELTLSHYRVLSKIENAKERNLLHRKTVREELSVPELTGEIRARKLLAGRTLEVHPSSTRGAKPLPPLQPRRGKFFTYQVIRPRDLHAQPEFYSIDVGFMNRKDLKLSGIKNPKEGEVIEAIRTEENDRGDRYRFKRVEKPKEGQAPFRKASELLYTYKATVVRVIDDDTLWAHVDLGFRFWTTRKLRFRGIDAAEIGKGKQASDFVKRTLARVPFVVIKVSGRDKFGRPLIDLFYLEETEDREKVLREGKFLNQELLDLGLARRV